jgi:hypothetical protein
MDYEGWLPRCILCKQSVTLEQSKADEYGRAVHEQCYVLLLVWKEPRFLARPEPKGERLSLMTMLMSAGWN